MTKFVLCSIAEEAAVFVNIWILKVRLVYVFLDLCPADRRKHRLARIKLRKRQQEGEMDLIIS